MESPGTSPKSGACSEPLHAHLGVGTLNTFAPEGEHHRAGNRAQLVTDEAVASGKALFARCEVAWVQVTPLEPRN